VRATPVDHDHRLVADNPGVMARRKHAYLARSDLELVPVRFPDPERAGDVKLEVGRLAKLRARHRLDVLRPAPARLNRVAADLPASDVEDLSLPEPMQAGVIRFLDENERWLERVLDEGRRDETLRFAEPARDAARLVVGALEGAMLVSRPYADVRRFQTAASALLASLAPAVD